MYRNAIHPVIALPETVNYISWSYVPIWVLLALHQFRAEDPAIVRSRARHRRLAMKRFGYARDPLCLAACACYAGNRWLIPAVMKGVFPARLFLGYAALIPAALPLDALAATTVRDYARMTSRRIGGKSRYTWWSWSIAAEVVAPHLFTRATGDPWDVAAYAGGALLSGIFWRLA